MSLKDRVSTQDLISVHGKITDISSTTGTNTTFIPCHISGDVVKIQSAIGAALTTAGGDATLTAKIGGTALTNGAITVAQSGSAAGVVDEVEPTGNNHVSAGEALEIESDGSSTGTCEAQITAVIQPDE